MIVQYHPLTASDLAGAISYYNQQRPGLGEEFRSEVYAAIERIRSNPFHYAVVEHDIRRCFVRRLPYGILFRIVNHETLRHTPSSSASRFWADTPIANNSNYSRD